MRTVFCLGLTAMLLQGRAVASAIVMEVQGKVSLVSGAGVAPATNGSLLQSGESIKTDDGGQATLKLPGQNFVTLGSSTEVRMATDSRVDVVRGRVGVEADASSPESYELRLSAAGESILPSMVAAFELDADAREMRVLSGDVDLVNGRLVRHAAEGQALELGSDSLPTTFRLAPTATTTATYQNAYTRPERHAYGENYRAASYALGDSTQGYGDDGASSSDFQGNELPQTGRWIPYNYGYALGFYSAIDPFWYCNSSYGPYSSSWDWWWDPWYRYSSWCGGWWWDPYYTCHSWYRYRPCSYGGYGWYRHRHAGSHRSLPGATARLLSGTTQETRLQSRVTAPPSSARLASPPTLSRYASPRAPVAAPSSGHVLSPRPSSSPSPYRSPPMPSYGPGPSAPRYHPMPSAPSYHPMPSAPSYHSAPPSYHPAPSSGHMSAPSHHSTAPSHSAPHAPSISHH